MYSHSRENPSCSHKLSIKHCHVSIFVLHFSPFYPVINIQLSSFKHVFTSREDSVEPDQMALSKPSDLDLQCFKMDKSGFSRTMVNRK